MNKLQITQGDGNVYVKERDSHLVYSFPPVLVEILVVVARQSNGKAIRACRAMRNLGLRDAKDFIDFLLDAANGSYNLYDADESAFQSVRNTLTAALKST